VLVDLPENPSSSSRPGLTPDQATDCETAREHWFTGPMVQGSAEELAAVEQELEGLA